jgi:hypothetical protein
MGGASFGNLPGNNAPAPVFGGTNPTGMIPGGYNTQNSYGFPSYNMFGTSSTGSGGSSGNSGYVTPMADQGTYSGIQGLTSGFGLPVNYANDPSLADSKLTKQLGKTYGYGAGMMLGNLLENGLFNPQIAQAYMNAMQPAYNQGIGNIEQAFGAEGARFGSSAALGIGNFASQFDLNEQQTMANMYMQAQQEQLQLLESVLPTLHGEKANSGGIGSSIIGGLASVASGGISNAISGIGNAISSMSTGTSPATNLSTENSTPNYTENSVSSIAANDISSMGDQDFINSWIQDYLSSTAGTSLGGDPTSMQNSMPGMMMGSH